MLTAALSLQDMKVENIADNAWDYIVCILKSPEASRIPLPLPSTSDS